MILILGCPRSGTSYISSICESFGYNFNIDNNNQLNLIYKPDVNYYQLKNLHFKLMSTNVNYFNNIDNFDFSEYYKDGQAGFAVLDIEVNNAFVGVIQIEERATTEKTIYL